MTDHPHSSAESCDEPISGLARHLLAEERYLLVKRLNSMNVRQINDPEGQRMFARVDEINIEMGENT